MASREKTQVAGAASPVRVAQLLFGRDPSLDVPIDHPTISTRHARLVQTLEGLLLEDLGSTNGTFVHGRRVERALVQPGDDVLLGGFLLPWGDARVQRFVRSSARPQQTVELGAVREVEHIKVPPARNTQAKRHARLVWYGILLVSVASLVAYGIGHGDELRAAFLEARTRLPEPAVFAPAEAQTSTQPPATSDVEEAIRAQRAARVAEAMRGDAPLVRNTAVRIAARSPGTFSVEQMALIWSHVREQWKYINDPRGTEYFASPQETLENDYAGDCDDFATLVAAMLGAVGGETRIVLMSGAEGGHAYAEVCLRDEATVIASKLQKHYRKASTRGKNRTVRSDGIAFRSDDQCPVWLNLDWNAHVPGGPYEVETWAVSIDAQGRTRTLIPARGASEGDASQADVSAPLAAPTAP